jgi:hypothetical protein
MVNHLEAGPKVARLFNDSRNSFISNKSQLRPRNESQDKKYKTLPENLD